MLVIFAVVVPETFTGGEVDPAALDQAIGLTSWGSWVVNLLIVEWWLHRRPGICLEISAAPAALPRAETRRRSRGCPQPW
jgi:hypothetical protein